MSALQHWEHWHWWRQELLLDCIPILVPLVANLELSSSSACPSWLGLVEQETSLAIVWETWLISYGQPKDSGNSPLQSLAPNRQSMAILGHVVGVLGIFLISLSVESAIDTLSSEHHRNRNWNNFL